MSAILILKRSGMARVNEGLHSFYLSSTRLSTNGMSHYCLYSQLQSITTVCPTINGNGQISTPPVALRLLNGFRWYFAYNYVAGIITHANLALWRCDNVGGLGQHVT